jgi:hypothetical protein
MTWVLEEDGADAGARGVGVELVGGVGTGVGEDENRGRDEGGFEGVEGVDGSSGERAGEGRRSLGEVSEGGGDLGVVLDEAAVETSEAEESAHGLLILGLWPISNGGDLRGSTLRLLPETMYPR